MAAALLQEISQDEHERARLRRQRMYEMDQVSNLLTAEERGIIRGSAEGKVEIISLLKKGLSIELNMGFLS